MRALTSRSNGIAAIFSAVFFAAQAFAWPPTYGSEFNFGSSEMNDAFLRRQRTAEDHTNSDWQTPATSEQEAAREFAEAVKKRCGEDCTVTPHVGKFRATEYEVRFNDGYHFNISVDPNCVEIITPPETLEHIKKYESRTQAFIFDVASSLGMTTTKKTAHFNVGLLSAFEGKPKAFLRYFTNFHNYQELASGVLGENYANAPPLSHLKPVQRSALAKIIEDVNRGKISRVQELATRIQKYVYTETPVFDVGYHYQGISVKYVRKDMNLKSDKPFELRSPRQPVTAHERTLLAELMEKRMKYEIEDPSPVAFLDVPKSRAFSNMELANCFRLYLYEMGESWDLFKELLPERLRGVPEDAFLSGKVNWNSKIDLDDVSSYGRYVANSQWVRNRMRALLSSPEAVASGKIPQILEGIKQSLGPSANIEAHNAIYGFLDAVSGSPRAQSHVGLPKCLLNSLQIFLQPSHSMR